MTWHTISGAGTSTGTKFFGDAMNKISNMFNGSDISDSVTIDTNVSWDFQGQSISNKESMNVAISDETTDLEAGNNKITFRMPYAFTLQDVRASVATAPVGQALILDINESGTTVLSRKIHIDSNEKTSTTSSSTPIISDSTLADDAEITIDIDQIGNTTAGAGAKVYLIGYQS